MQKPEGKIFSSALSLTVAALIALSSGVAAQSAGEAKAQEQQAVSATPKGPHITGTVTRWNGNRMDLKLADGKIQKVAVNNGTEKLVEVKDGTEVTVEYRREISGFVIAERVLPAVKAAPAAQASAKAAPGQKVPAVTGSIVSWNDAALLLRTETGDVTLFLSPSTEYLVQPGPGMQVTAEYREGADRAKVATRVLAAERKTEDVAENQSGSE